MKVAAAILKTFFFLILLVVNIIGFSYYFRPVAEQNLLCIPSDSKMVVTVNLKSISGKLFNELLFHPESFEEELISSRERRLVFDNSTYGVDLFSKVAFFTFPVANELYFGISFGISDPGIYAQKLEAKDYPTYLVDGIRIYEGNNTTFFIYEKAAVIVLSSMDKELASDIAVKNFRNDEKVEGMLSGGDFQVLFRKGIWEDKKLGDFFKMLPSWFERISWEGNFNADHIEISGQLNLGGKHNFIRTNNFIQPSPDELEKANLQWVCKGEIFENLIGLFLREVMNSQSDSTGKLKQFVESNHQGICISTNKLILHSDLFSLGRKLAAGNMIDPAMSIDIRLLNEKMSTRFESMDVSENLSSFIPGNTNHRKVVLSQQVEKLRGNQLYFYFNPDKFVHESKFNLLVNTIIEPALIFKDVFIYADRIEGSSIYFKGKIRLKETETHSLIQLRELVKKMSAVI